MIGGEEDFSWLDDVDEEAEEWLRDQPPPEGDILSAKEPAGPKMSEGENAFVQALYDDNTPRTSFPTVPIGTEGRYVQVIRSLQKLRPQQRTFIRALVQEAGDIPSALRVFNARHKTKLSHNQVSRWNYNPDYKLSLQTAKNYFLDLHGIDPSSVLLRSMKVYSEAMDPKPVLHQGRATGYYERELGTAARIVSDQAKWAGLEKEDNNAGRVRVRIIRMSSRGQGDEAIEVDTGGSDE